MGSTIEGKEVDPHLLTIVDKPHLVPVTMMPFMHGAGYEDLKGYVEGHISAFEAEFVVKRIRELVINLLRRKIGRPTPANDKTLAVRELDVLGKKVFLTRGIKSNPGVAIDQCDVNADGGEDSTFWDRLSIAADGYVFTGDRERQCFEQRSIPLDTDGEWIKDLLGETAADEEKRRIEGTERGDLKYALRQLDDGRILLTDDSGEIEDRNMRPGGWFYRDRFLPVADITEKRMYSIPRELPDAMAVVLRVHNLLYVVHKTCIGEQGLPGEVFREWELPRK